MTYFSLKSNTFQVIELTRIYFFLKCSDINNDHNSKYRSYVLDRKYRYAGMADNFQITVAHCNKLTF